MVLCCKFSLTSIAVSLTSLSMSKKVKVQVDTEVDDFPKIVTFPLGVPENVEEMQINVAQKPSTKKVKTIVSSKINGITYKGTDFGDSVKVEGCKYAVAIHDVKANKIRIVGANHVFGLEPQFDAFVAPVRQSTMTYSERKKSLTEEFGSTKKKRAMKAAASNVISAENIAGVSALENALAVAPSAENDELLRIAQENLSKNKRRKK